MTPHTLDSLIDGIMPEDRGCVATALYLVAHLKHRQLDKFLKSVRRDIPAALAAEIRKSRAFRHWINRGVWPQEPKQEPSNGQQVVQEA